MRTNIFNVIGIALYNVTDPHTNYTDSTTYSYSEYHTLKIGQALFNKDLPEHGWKVFHLVPELNPESVYANNFIGDYG